MNYKSLLNFLTIICFTLSWGQSKTIENVLFESINIMEKHAVEAKTVPWKQFRMKVKKKWKSRPNEETMVAVLLELMEYLDDYHGSFHYKDSMYQWNSNTLVVPEAILNELKKGAAITSQLLEDQIGYLRVPSMPYLSKEDCNNKAQQLNDNLCSLFQENPKGLIIDLRLNGGGAMYPMILGLQQLLEKGNIGSYTSQDASSWYLEEKRFLMGSTLFAELQTTCLPQYTDIPVAFLISPVTGSSAEFLLIAFQGRPNTILVGTPTAGFLTATQGFAIDDDAFLLLSTAYGMDRNGIVYKDAFLPDIPCSSSDEFIDLSSDDKVKKAIAWIKKKQE